MSAISNFYIHYWYKDYQVPVGAVKQQENKNKMLLKQLPTLQDHANVIDELRKRLQQNMAMISNSQKQQILSSQASFQISTIIANKLRSQVDGGTNPPASSDIYQPNIDIQALKQKRKEISKHIQKINSVYYRNSSAQISDDDLLCLIQEYEDLYTLIEHAKAQIIIPPTGGKSDAQSLIGQIRELLDEYTFSTAATAAIGDFGENLVAACNDTARQGAAKDIYKAIRLGLQGTGRVEYTIDFSNLLQSTLKITQQDLSDRKVRWNIGRTQNKVDAVISIDNFPLDISVKGTNKDRKVVTFELQEMNVLTTLAATSANFMNHWMNVHAAHKYLDDREVPSDASADEALERFMAYQALASGTIQKNLDPANVFCAINEANGQLYIKTTRQILEDYNNIRINPRVDSLQFQLNNEWVYEKDGEKQRNLNVIEAVNQAHVTVSINVSF